MKAMIFAAGLGTRLQPWTNHHPKALAPFKESTLLENLIERIYFTTGITHFIVNVHHFARQIIDTLNKNTTLPGNINIEISDETDRLLDTGGGLLKVLEHYETDHLLVHNVDVVTDFNYNLLIDHHLANNYDMTLLVSSRASSRKLIFNDNMELQGWINLSTGQTLPPKIESTFNQLAFNGVYLVSSRIKPTLKQYSQSISTTQFPVVPFFVNTCERLKTKGFISPLSYRWIDVGTPEKLQLANNTF